MKCSAVARTWFVPAGVSRTVLGVGGTVCTGPPEAFGSLSGVFAQRMPTSTRMPTAAATLPQRRRRRRKRGDQRRLPVPRPLRRPLCPCGVDRDRVCPARPRRGDLPLRPELLHLEEEEA